MATPAFTSARHRCQPPSAKRSSPRANARFELLLLTGGGLLVLFAASLPGSLLEILPPCPWHALTGTYCPGCGTGRGLAGILSGDLLALWRMNKLAVLALPFLAAWLAGRLHLAATGKRLPHRLGEPLSGRWVLAVVLCYWIARNLLPLLAPFPQ